MSPPDWTDKPKADFRILDPSTVSALKAALVASDDEAAPVFAVVTMGGSDACPVLGEQLALVVRRALGGLPLVLICRVDQNEWRTYGDPHLFFEALKLDFDALGWVDLPPLSSR